MKVQVTGIVKLVMMELYQNVINNHMKLFLFCSDCLHWYYECEEWDKRYDEDFVSSCSICAEIREYLENENSEE